MTNEDAHTIAALAIRYWRTHCAWIVNGRAAARAKYEAEEAMCDALRDCMQEMTDAPPVYAGPDESVDFIIADLRRLYHHIHAGGEVDRNIDAKRLSRGIAALEGAQARQHACLAATH